MPLVVRSPFSVPVESSKASLVFLKSCINYDDNSLDVFVVKLTLMMQSAVL